MNNYTGHITTSMENSRNSLRRIARNDDTEFSHLSILNAMETFVKTVSTMDETILVPCRLMDLKVCDADDTTATRLATPNTTSVSGKQSYQQHKRQGSAGGVSLNGDDGGGGGVANFLNAADLFDVYNMIHEVRGQLLWGQDEDVMSTAAGDWTEQQTTEQRVGDKVSINSNTLPIPPTTPPNNSAGAVASTHVIGHVRRPSTVSVGSTNSSSSSSGISDSDSELGNENDSGIEESTPSPNSSSVTSTQPKVGNSISTNSATIANAAKGSSDNGGSDRTRFVATNFCRHLSGLSRSLRQLTEAAQYLTVRYQHDIGNPV